MTAGPGHPARLDQPTERARHAVRAAADERPYPLGRSRRTTAHLASTSVQVRIPPGQVAGARPGQVLAEFLGHGPAFPLPESPTHRAARPQSQVTARVSQSMADRPYPPRLRSANRSLKLPGSLGSPPRHTPGVPLPIAEVDRDAQQPGGPGGAHGFVRRPARPVPVCAAGAAGRGGHPAASHSSTPSYTSPSPTHRLSPSPTPRRTIHSPTPVPSTSSLSPSPVSSSPSPSPSVSRSTSTVPTSAAPPGTPASSTP